MKGQGGLKLKSVTIAMAALVMVSCAGQPSENLRPLARNPTADACADAGRCAPITIASFPFTDRGDTRVEGRSRLARYGCAAQKNLSGRELVYTFTISRRSLLLAEVDDKAGDGVDIDLHLLSSLDEGGCLSRHNRALYELLEPGQYYLVADTFVGKSGVPAAGPFTLRAHLQSVPDNACAMREGPMMMRWKTCAEGIACQERKSSAGKLRRFLQLPAVGPVVKEAHLVTVDDDFGPREWPSSGTHGIDEHHGRAQGLLSFSADLNQPWAPAGEGGSRWGQGSSGHPLPVEDEMWYITMNWAERPKKGVRMIVRNPTNGRAVVAAAGYETGPGSPTAVAGVSEEIHRYLGTTHRDPLMVGFAVDPSLTLGPVGCDD